MPPCKEPRHEKFCRLRVKGKGQLEAYVMTGYDRDDGNASRLDNEPHIIARKQELMERAAELACIDQSWVLDRLTELTDRCMQKVAVLDDDGNPTGEWKFEHTGANSSLDKLAKHVGFYNADNKQQSKKEVRIVDFSDADLLDSE